MLVSKPQPDGTTKDIHKVVLIIARQLYTDDNDDSSFQVFHDIGSFFKFALLSKKRSYFWAHNAQGYDIRLLFSNVSHISLIYKPSNIIMRGEKILQFCIKRPNFETHFVAMLQGNLNFCRCQDDLSFTFQVKTYFLLFWSLLRITGWWKYLFGSISHCANL